MYWLYLENIPFICSYYMSLYQGQRLGLVLERTLGNAISGPGQSSRKDARKRLRKSSGQRAVGRALGSALGRAMGRAVHEGPYEQP